jgi:hypothetical protein
VVQQQERLYRLLSLSPSLLLWQLGTFCMVLPSAYKIVLWWGFKVLQNVLGSHWWKSLVFYSKAFVLPRKTSSCQKRLQLKIVWETWARTISEGFFKERTCDWLNCPMTDRDSVWNFDWPRNRPDSVTQMCSHWKWEVWLASHRTPCRRDSVHDSNDVNSPI